MLVRPRSDEGNMSAVRRTSTHGIAGRKWRVASTTVKESKGKIRSNLKVEWFKLKTDAQCTEKFGVSVVDFFFLILENM